MKTQYLCYRKFNNEQESALIIFLERLNYITERKRANKSSI